MLHSLLSASDGLCSKSLHRIPFQCVLGPYSSCINLLGSACVYNTRRKASTTLHHMQPLYRPAKRCGLSVFTIYAFYRATTQFHVILLLSSRKRFHFRSEYMLYYTIYNDYDT